jgi:ribosomal protein S18 acetylase RimI-like enzyme
MTHQEKYSLIIRDMQNVDLKACFNIFHACINHDSLLYKPFDQSSFAEHFSPSKDEIFSFVITLHNKILGFISGTQYQQKVYLTMLAVDKDYQKQGLGTKLLRFYEKFITSHFSDIKCIYIVFYNNIHLPWYIPHTPHHEHPNAPGVDLDSKAYHFFLSQGYECYAIQYAYYKSLEHSTRHPHYEEHIIELQKDHISIEFFNQKIHVGLATLFDYLKNPTWRDEIIEAIDANRPVLIASHHNMVIGFAGPLDVEPSKRGYFAGIGINPNYRNKGIGKALFSSLCFHLKNMGADYMSLFTGSNNPAKRIYQDEGFSHIKSWGNMKKDIAQN